MKCSKNLIKYPDKAGCTPLHKAASSGHKDCLSALLKKGGDLAAETNTGVTVVDEIFTNLTRPVDFLLRILDSKITFTQHNSVLSSDHGCKILLDFDLLTPKKYYKTKINIVIISRRTWQFNNTASINRGTYFFKVEENETDIFIVTYCTCLLFP
ncbi:uncharacterized protein LOC142320473 [Lycorma delicatula]|uniref:uncharacterized protein LOC142320473 n=1 Tax=Lycorma delicatula TaxID=130591 RepID=UPI003F517911